MIGKTFLQTSKLTLAVILGISWLSAILQRAWKRKSHHMT